MNDLKRFPGSIGSHTVSAKMIRTLILLATIASTGFAEDGIFSSVRREQGKEVKVLKSDGSSWKVWLGPQCHLITDTVEEYEFDNELRIRWKGGFVGKRPNWVFAVIGKKVFKTVSIAGPTIRDGKADGKYAISFTVSDPNEARILGKLLKSYKKRAEQD